MHDRDREKELSQTLAGLYEEASRWKVVNDGGIKISVAQYQKTVRKKERKLFYYSF